MKKLYTIEAKMVSDDIEDIIVQLDDIRDKLQEGFESSNNSIDGACKGHWSINFIEHETE